MNASSCSCDQFIEGHREEHTDGTVTFHTFGACPRVKVCEHVKRIETQSHVNEFIGPDGRCIECAAQVGGGRR